MQLLIVLHITRMYVHNYHWLHLQTSTLSPELTLGNFNNCLNWWWFDVSLISLCTEAGTTACLGWCCPHGKFPISSMLSSFAASETWEAWLLYPELKKYDPGLQLGRSWSTWALILLRTCYLVFGTSLTAKHAVTGCRVYQQKVPQDNFFQDFLIWPLLA